MTRTRMSLVILSTLLGGCGSEPDGGDDPGAGQEAPATEALPGAPEGILSRKGTPAADEPLVGVWETAGRDGRPHTRYTLGADGSAELAGLYVSPPPTLRGTWQRMGDTLVLDLQDLSGLRTTRVDRLVHHTSFYVNGDTLALGALIPETETRGLVGTWTMDAFAQAFRAGRNTQSTTISMSLALREDGTVTMTMQLTGGARPVSGSVEGRYELEAEDRFVLTFRKNGETLRMPGRLIDGRALGLFADTARQ